MKLLAIETATMMTSVSLTDNNTPIVEHNVGVRLDCSERLIFTVQRVLEDGRTSLESVDGIAVSIGPGSFTGVRIGVATAKALSYSAGKPLLAVPTLEGLAALFATEGMLMCPVMDARKGEVYFSLFRTENGTLTEVLPPACAKPGNAAEIVSASARNGENVLVGGPGSQLLEKSGVEYGRFTFSGAGAAYPRAFGIALRGEEMLRSGRVADALTLVPLYVRVSDAELKLGRRID